MEIPIYHICYGITSQKCIKEMPVLHTRLSLVIFTNDTVLHKSYIAEALISMQRMK